MSDDPDKPWRLPNAKRMTFDDMAARAQYEWQRAEDAEAEVKHQADRIEELEAQIAAMEEGLTAVHMAGYIDGKRAAEAKLAQQNDLVQAAVAAALREAANIARASLDGELGYDDILALITEDAQAALDRVVAAQQGARPIGTAPRDGTHILIAPYGDPTDLQVSWFIDGEDRWANWSWSVEPSHWFPLPVIRKGEE